MVPYKPVRVFTQTSHVGSLFNLKLIIIHYLNKKILTNITQLNYQYTSYNTILNNQLKNTK